MVISFHSLEDRIVKTFIARESKSEFDRRAPFAAPRAACGCARSRRVKPGPTEVRANPRARSAVMRVAERTDVLRRRPGMTRLNVLLLVVLLVSSALPGARLVRVAAPVRRRSTRRSSEERALDSDSERLKTEKRSQATPLRVEQTARESLAMRSGDAGGDAVRRAAAARASAAAAPAAIGTTR